MRTALAAGILIFTLAAAAFAWASWPSIPPGAPPGRAAFPIERIRRGAELAAIGDCAVCHTTRDGQPYAGGRAVPTPFGVVYATNITPDPKSGIGTWSEAAFRRAMRQGIARNGAHLYPVLPYPHFTRASDADIAALYAFLMTRTPVDARPPPNRLVFPLNQRIVLAGWNLLFLRPGPWRPDPAHDAVWNRGAYLVEAVGHCGACHTPHNALGAEEAARRLGGGEAERWYAPPLQGASPAPQPWTEAALATYLRTGFDAQHGAAAGPMTAVTTELGDVPDADVTAMATYVASLMPRASPGSRPPADGTRPAVNEAEAARPLFQGACAGCHGADAPMMQGGAPSLALSTSVNAATPRGVVQVILNGIPWRRGVAQPYMPPFAAALTNDQVAALAGYVRAAYSNKPAWADVPATVKKLRPSGGA
jgi:mono/diheme cytochrome c family protein